MNQAELKEQARGRWQSILKYYGITVHADNRHQPCPTCGGTDRFRFDDRDGRGTWFCSQCEPHAGDGFALLRKVKGWSFPQTLEEVAAFLRLPEPTPPPKARTNLAAVRRTAPYGTLGVDLFVYQDATGQPVIYVKRTDRSQGGKSFCQWGQTLEHTGWQRNLHHAPKPRPLYHLPAIIASSDADIIFHEGEKATEAAIAAGLPGVHVTTLGGGGNPHHSDFSPLRGQVVVVCPDNDPPGLEYAAAVTRLALEAGASRVDVLQWPGLPPKGDAVEWVAAGGTPARFAELLRDLRDSISSGPGGPCGPSLVVGRPEAWNSHENGPGPGGPSAALVQPELSAPLEDDSISAPLSLADFPPLPGYRIEAYGVYELAKSEDKPDVRLTLAPCGVIAHSRDGHRENWGALLLWLDRDGTRHEAVHPMGRFHEPGGPLPADLANLGLPIIPGRERALLRYFGQGIAKTRLRAAIQTGWQDQAPVFVLPSEILGERATDERIVYQPERFSPTRQSVRTEGSLFAWQTDVAMRCEGNPVLAFFMAAALAAPLLSLLRQEGGGFHLYGQTSKGKTTALQVAASVWGDASDPAAGRSTTFVRKWNLTKNATEGLAEAHTDLPLCLDEVGEVDAQDFGRMVYQLAGGQGKGRMRQDATLLKPKAWRILLLSTGELPAAAVIESQGKMVKGGQAVRLLDVPATDPLTGQGIIAEGSDKANLAAFVDRLKESCAAHYGWAGPAFIKALIDQGLEQVSDELRAAWTVSAETFTPTDASPEVQRAVKRFAVVAVAGEKAVSLGILPWKPGEAVGCTRLLLARYLAARGGAGTELEQGVECVKAFLHAHGSSRLRDLSREEDRIFSLAGYRDSRNEFFYLTPAGFKEACGGHDPKEVARLLHARGWLDAPDRNHFKRRVRIPGMGRPWLYAISAEILDDAVPEESEHSALDRSIPSAGPS